MTNEANEEDVLAEELGIDEDDLEPQRFQVDPEDPSWRLGVRTATRAMYDFQRMRIQVAGRIPTKKDGGKKLNAPEFQLDAKDQAMMERVASDLASTEKFLVAYLGDRLRTVSIYNAWVKDQRGIGPMMAGVLLSEFRIHRAGTVSDFWSFAGLGVEREFDVDYELDGKKASGTFWAATPNGVKAVIPAPKEKRATLRVIVAGPTSKPAERQRRRPGQLTSYNSWLRSKLVFVLAGNLLKLKSPYAQFYYDYKARKEAAGWGKSKGHRHRAALRYMVKRFLADFWVKWRELEGLEVRPPYAEQYLGKPHHP